MITHQTQLSSCNKVTVEIKETFMGTYSIVAYDELQDFWFERYAPTIAEATRRAERIHKYIVKKYSNNP